MKNFLFKTIFLHLCFNKLLFYFDLSFHVMCKLYFASEFYPFSFVMVKLHTDFVVSLIKFIL